MKEAIEAAKAAWNDAPLHVRMMASAYVSPLLAALVAIAAEIDTMKGGQQ